MAEFGASHLQFTPASSIAGPRAPQRMRWRRRGHHDPSSEAISCMLPAHPTLTRHHTASRHSDPTRTTMHTRCAHHKHTTNPTLCTLHRRVQRVSRRAISVCAGCVCAGFFSSHVPCRNLSVITNVCLEITSRYQRSPYFRSWLMTYHTRDQIHQMQGFIDRSYMDSRQKQTQLHTLPLLHVLHVDIDVAPALLGLHRARTTTCESALPSPQAIDALVCATLWHFPRRSSNLGTTIEASTTPSSAFSCTLQFASGQAARSCCAERLQAGGHELRSGVYGVWRCASTIHRCAVCWKGGPMYWRQASGGRNVRIATGAGRQGLLVG